MSHHEVSFDGNDLSAFTGIELYNHDFNRLPKREIKINKIARRDLSIITSSEYSSKEISVFFELCGGGRGDTEVLMAFLKSLVQTQNALLVVLQGDEQTEYTATMNEFNHSWLGTRAIVEIVFIASDPIGRNQDETTMASIVGITTSTSSASFEVQGSATAYPIITVTVSAVTGGTGQTISVINSRTNQGITIEANWANGDILVIDSYAMEARINGAIVDFTGIFPQFNTGLGQIGYSDSFTTRTVTLSAVYQARLV